MSRKIGTRRARAFALVITLALLALLVLAVLSLSALVRVNGQVSLAGVYQVQARQNAFAGLTKAIDHLQRVAGQDRRITATADILSGRDDSKRYWTGVWDETGALRSWLVSGPDQDPLSAVQSSDISPLIQLVGINSAAADTPAVKVQAEPIYAYRPGADEESPLGHYAYWISDEGVKATARFSQTADLLDYNDGARAFVPRAVGVSDANVHDATKRMRQMLLPRPRIETIASALNPESPVTRTALSRLENFNQLRFAATGAIQLTPLFHDLTLASRGVLSDPARGGLKRDISAPGASGSGLSVAAVSWMSARPSSQSGITAVHRIASLANGFAIGPVITEIGLRFRFFRTGSAAAASGNLSVRCQMQLELWNPYTSTLASNGTPLRVNVGGLPQNLVVTTGSGLSFTVNLQAAFDSMLFQLPADAVFEPGRLSVFYGGTTWNQTSATNASAPGLAYDFGYSIPGTVAANRWLEVSSANPGETNSLTVELRHGASTLSTQSPAAAFSAVLVPRTNGWNETTTSPWQFGFGYSLRDSLSFWSDGSSSESRDPRATGLTGSFTESVQSVWQIEPSLNAAVMIARSGTTTSGTTFYAASGQGAPAFMLFELPRQEIISLGALQHAPGLRPNEIGNPWGSSLNAVFDTSFLSTLPRNDILWNLPPLPLSPNPFLEFYPGTGRSTQASLLDPDSAASNLLVYGAFNVNSTSEKAWRAALGGLRVPQNYTVPDELSNAFFRHSHSAQESSTSATKPTGAATARRQGVRELTDDQVRALASAMAILNRNRPRPFLSLLEFINNGSMTQALDPTSVVGGESSQMDRSSINGGNVLSRGLPSYLSQADIITAIAPMISVRSDTFRIRAYGHALNPADNKVESAAYCEAIVQRVPDFFEPTQPPSATVLNSTNSQFGRKFVITSFRWLGPDDI